MSEYRIRYEVSVYVGAADKDSTLEEAEEHLRNGGDAEWELIDVREDE